MNNHKKILAYAKENISSFEKISVSSNEIYVFDFQDKKYILKIHQSTGTNLHMMQKVSQQSQKFHQEKNYLQNLLEHYLEILQNLQLV